MAYQSVFQRYEMKYLITRAQKESILEAMRPYTAADRYGITTIQNLYLDTDSYRLIRRSMEKPVYKEKLRLRSYGRAAPGQEIFVELKKKYKGVVYKRRIALPEETALGWLQGEAACPVKGQIAEEIDYFRSFYAPLQPKVFLAYDRQAWYSLSGDGFRVTFDENILFRREALSLAEPAWGTALLAPGQTLMEIKCAGAIPLWMCHALSREGIRKTSFSNYGTAYTDHIFPTLQGGQQNDKINIPRCV